ncbi:MAG: class I SAM-dependent methyltransferase, partial [Pseudomonadales bacterium]|nr:class I SAM-dependent methyltransferase [Pseudomonadales bacterium]
MSTSVTEKLQQLQAHLQNQFNVLPTDASRLFHGRGHCYDDLKFINIDWFEPVIWVVLYGDVDDEFVTALAALLSSMAAEQDKIKAVSIQRRVKGKAQQDVVYGQMPEKCIAVEDGFKMVLNLSENQNIGFFLDARPGRQWLAEKAAGKRVLNLFSYTCSFSIAALKAGADSVVNIDMAKGALATGQRNHALNDLDIKRASFLPHDIFRST